MRTLQSAAITLFFLAMMALLVRDHVIPSLSRGTGIDVDRRVLADSWSNQDDWMRIKLGGQALGALRTTAEGESGTENYTMTSHLDLQAGFLKARLLSASRLNKNLELQTVKVRVCYTTMGGKLLSPEELDAPELPAKALELVGLVEGNVARFRVRRDESVQYFEQRLARPVTLADSVTPILRGQMLTKGVDYAIDVYDPMFGNNAGKLTVNYLRDEEEQLDGEPETMKKVQLKYQNSRMLLTVDTNGNVVRREIPLIAPSQASSTNEVDKVPTLVLERVKTADARRDYPELEYVPDPPTLTAADVTGVSKGELLKGVNLFSVIAPGGQK
jgi:hypothetical protein